MAFAPSSTIYLCSVPFDNTYKHQYYISNQTAQYSFFSKKAKHILSDYYTIRETLPDGGNRTLVKVSLNIDTLLADGINYVFWCNANHGGRNYFAFVTDLIYVNEGTTKLVLETDVYQTWAYDIILRQSFVVRQHTRTDAIGDNLVPEKIGAEDYSYSSLTKAGALDEFGYLIASSAPRAEGDGVGRGRLMSGIYQGLYFYYLKSPNEVNSCLDDIEAQKGDSVQFIALIPRFCLGNASVSNNGFVSSTLEPAQREISVTLDEADYTFEGYTPKNNKLFTSPYFSLMVTNNNGEEAIYPFECFETYGTAKFRMYGDISATPSVTLIPKDYRGYGCLADFGINLTSFPQSSFNSDSFKLWLAKNAGKNALSVASTLAVSALSGPAGAIGLVGAAYQTAQIIGNTWSASHEPNKAHIGNTNSNLLTAIEQNDYNFLVRKVRRHHAEVIDNYFTMYGYQINRVQTPERNTRKYYCYVQTKDVNIEGDIPADHMARLKAIFDNGITFWQTNATIGNYSADNTPRG